MDKDNKGADIKIRNYFKRSFRSYCLLHPESFTEIFELEPTEANIERTYLIISNGGSK